MQEFPKCLYRNGPYSEYVVVHSKEQENQQRENGFFSADESAEKPADKDDLIAQAEAKGVKVDRRWSIERIQAALNDAGE